PPGTECFDIFSPPPGDSEVISQLERLNSNETKIAPRLVWIAVNGSDLSAPTFMVSSKMDGSDPHFDPESIATHNTSWDLEKDDVQADPATLPGKADTAGCCVPPKSGSQRTHHWREMDGFELRSCENSGSQATPRWRSESAANSSLKMPKFP